MKQHIVRLFVKIMDYPDKLENALARCIHGTATWWDKARLGLARRLW
jgi:hypothetical protein